MLYRLIINCLSKNVHPSTQKCCACAVPPMKYQRHRLDLNLSDRMMILSLRQFFARAPVNAPTFKGLSKSESSLPQSTEIYRDMYL